MSRIAPTSVTGPVRTKVGRFFRGLMWMGAAIVAAIPLLVGLIWLSTPSEEGTRTTYRPPIDPSSARVTVRVRPANTNESCLGELKRLTLDTADNEFNPNGCFVYPRVDVGRVILSGPLGQDELGPEGNSGDARPMYKARAKSAAAEMRYILCAGQKSNPKDGKWSCA